MVITRSQTRLAPPSTSADPQSAAQNQPESSGIIASEAEVAGLMPIVYTTAAPSHTRTHSVASRTSRLSATVTARKLAVEAQHARNLARMELAAQEEEMKSQLAAKKYELEKNAMELEHQAELAAIEAENSEHGTRSRGSIQDWLEKGNESIVLPNISKSNHDILPNDQHSKQSNQLAVTQINTIQNNIRNIKDNNFPQASIPSYNDVCNDAARTEPPFTSQTSFQRNDYGLVPSAAHQRQGDVDPVHQLVSAFDRLVNKIQPTNSNHQKLNINLPIFDGKSPLDWLVFKRSYIDSAGTYTPSENLGRLSVALKGAAREAVCVLLATALQPSVVIQELDRRFGRPEQIVLREVASIRILPRINNDLKELSMFSSRVRNCVEVVKLLNETDYLHSPELFSVLINKLPILLRTRWIDYAAARATANAHGPESSSARVEMLSEFLAREVDLRAKFDDMAESHGYLPRERAHAVSEAYSIPVEQSKSTAEINQREQNIQKNDSCVCCKQTHDISTCDNFKSMTVSDRWHFIKENKICYRCLKKGPHVFRLCNKNKERCEFEHCGRKHHSLLHDPDFIPTTTAHIDENAASASVASSFQASAATTSSAHETSREVAAHTTATADSCVLDVSPTYRPLLKVVAVTVSGPGGSVDTFALLDDGSTATFIDSKISDSIGVDGPEGHIYLDCVGGLSRETTVKYVDFKIKGRHANANFSVHRARSISDLGIVCKQSASYDFLRKYPYLSDIATELCYENARPMLIIGLDNWHLSIATATKKGTKSQPVAIQTALGWVIFGFPSSKTRPVETICHVQLTASDNQKLELDELIKAQYKLDAIGISNHEARSTDDQRALEILERTAHRLPDGRFEVGLLWKADCLMVPNSYPLALSRFRSLEAKMLREPDYAEQYRKNIHDTFIKGYAEECTALDPKGVCWYLPHFGVTNPNKPGKLRVVHDAAAQSRKVSLNSMLLPGPDFLQSLVGILMRFREGRVALTADIKEMFPQVKIIQQDRDAQRFLWRDDPSDPIKVYRMSSMIFGACSSPSTAIFIMNLNASEFHEEFPEAVERIKRDTYMDDFICSVDSLNDASRLAAEVETVHKRGGFEMRGWITNDPAALTLLPVECLSDLVIGKSLELHINAVNRTLGLIWQPALDELKFNFIVSSDSSAPITKRQALIQVMRIYDPLGILMPVVVKGRILFQNLWRKGLDWDERFSEDDCKVWHEWFESLKSIEEIRVPRWYNLRDIKVSQCELHMFCDASESAYVAVAYWRYIDDRGQVCLALISSRARVAPLKPTSIPRLELQGALIATRLATFISEAHRHKPQRRYFWCDSMTVLGWLRSDARKYKPYVANRVGEIRENSTLSEWRWIPTNLNVADDATRLDRSVLNMESRWISGPSFLLSPSTEWPKEKAGHEKTENLNDVELKPSARIKIRSSPLSNPLINDICNCNNVMELPLPIAADPACFSSWLRLVRATARAHQFIAACITRVRGVSNNFILSKHSTTPCTSSPLLRPLTAQVLEYAEVHILRKSQENAFQQEVLCLRRGRPIPPKSKLVSLTPALNSNGLLFVRGRASNAVDVTTNTQPILLDGKDPAVRLLISHFHNKFVHANTETVINEIRQQYWILGLRNSVRMIVRNCQFCKLVRGKPVQPPMGDLPEARLAHSKRPFTFVGLDYFGPLLITIGRRNEKRWIALFTCMTTRAIHLEVVHSLSTDAAIMCLRRFIARRGTPSQILSDNGTAFVGANRLLRELYGEAVTEYVANNKIEWKFIPPSAPFMGGAWERLVKSVKTALRVTLRDRKPSDEVLATLLAEAEALVNSRPLTHISPDPADPEALTPFHFILGSSSGRSIPAQLNETDLCSRSGWRRAIRLADHFWKRWVREYLPSLAPRRIKGSRVTTARIGDPVLIADGDLPRGTWPRGIITATFPGRDGVVRVVDVRTSAGTLRRPLKKIVVL